jgi:Xaa-Pro aminopeptidase
MLKKKIQNIQALIRQQKLDGLLIGNFGHQIHDDILYYLLLTHLELGMLYIPSRGKPTLYGISFEVNQLKKRYSDIIVRPYIGSMGELLKRHVTKTSILSIRPQSLPHAVFRQLKKIKGLSMRHLTGEELLISQKLPEETERIQEACTITDTIFASLLEDWSNFKTEQDAADHIIMETARHGIEPSFPPIVASGARASNPHHHPAKTRLTQGFCVIDMGVRYKGYCSDMTRTIFVGTPKKAEYALYQTLLSIQEACVKKVTVGASTKNIDEFCRDSLGPILNDQFIHGLGHGVGTQVHEWPSISAYQDLALKEGMVVTIEPGVYLSGKYGIRIEDDVLVTKHGPIILNNTPKKLITI